VNTLSVNQYLFLRWLATRHPKLYDAAGPVALKGVLDVAGSLFQNVLEVAPKIYTEYVSGQQELKILKGNLARAKAGLGPLNPDGTPYVLPPGSQYPAGVQPAGQNWMLWVAIGLGIFLLFRR
jgi:hypothetical protein